MPRQLPAFDPLQFSSMYVCSYSIAHCLTLQRCVAIISCTEVQIDRYITSLFSLFLYFFTYLYIYLFIIYFSMTRIVFS